MKLFGQYLSEDFNTNNQITITSSLNQKVVYRKGTYISFGNAVMINVNSHGFLSGNTAYLQFNSGNTAAISNGIFTVTLVNSANSFNIVHKNSANTSGNVYSGIVV